MPPYPKHPSARARRNQVSTATALVVTSPNVKPELPQRYRVVKVKEDGETITVREPADWHPNALYLWEALWSSEMVDEFLGVDIPTLIRLVALETEYWERFEDGRSTTMVSSNIDALIKQYGLTPMARRSLDWVIAETEETTSKTRKRNTKRVDVTLTDADIVELPLSAPTADPTDVLYQ